jgi:EmrB/QacA subfamily drug resistance transporter
MGSGVRLGLVVACAAHFLVGVDGLAVAIALPALQRDLDAAPIDAQWVLTAYGLTFGGGLLLGGRLGDLYGRRRLLAGGMTLFAAGALLAGLAPALWLLVAARAVQGAGAAAAVPAALALIGSLFPEGRARSRALAVLGAMASVGVMSGLVLGGAVTELLGWRWVFLVMVPLGLLAALVAPRVLAEAAAGPALSRRPDVGGAVLLTAAMVTLLLGVTRIEYEGVASAAAAGPVLAGLALLVAFVAWERRTPAPLVRFDVLAVPSLRGATFGVGINSIAFTAIVYVGTLYLQNGLGYGPFQAGLALLPVDVAAFAMTALAARMVARRSPRALLAVSFAVTALAMLWLARAPVPAGYVVDIMAPLVVLGVSLCVAFVALTHEAVAEVRSDDKGLASGIFETSSHLVGGAVGVALYATVLAATGHGTGFLAAAVLAALGSAVVLFSWSGRRPARR